MEENNITVDKAVQTIKGQFCELKHKRASQVLRILEKKSLMFNQKFYYMWQKYFIVIILFCLYACNGERKEQNANSTIIEKKWAKDCSNDSKIHVLSSNAQFANGKKVLTNKQEYMQMTKDCIYNVETLVAKYLDDKDKNHYSNKNNTIDCYFRQYLCYKENMHLFVFANLYAYRTTKYEINTTNAFADNPKNHVINPLNGNNKDYKMFIVDLSEKSIHCFTKEKDNIVNFYIAESKGQTWRWLFYG